MVTFALPDRARRPGFAGLPDLVRRVRHWRTRARNRALMLEFDDRMLRDIGICPAQAAFECRKPFWRD